jgi:hypothetical protein
MRTPGHKIPSGETEVEPKKVREPPIVLSKYWNLWYPDVGKSQFGFELLLLVVQLSSSSFWEAFDLGGGVGLYS